MPSLVPLAVACVFRLAAAQQVGTVTAEGAPAVEISQCTAADCTTEPLVGTLDANWRWLHDAAGYENCYTDGNWSAAYCPDGQTCAQRCALEGVDAEGYRSTYGISPVPGGLELQFVGQGGNVGSRVYLTEPAGDSYKVFRLKNREFALDVDVSGLPCGLNGAVYFVEMDATGGQGVGNNQAGAKYGTGYCDAQCPHDIKFISGEANVHGHYGTCCFEMDIWEANSLATAFTPHTCSLEAPMRCEGVECGDGDRGERYMGVCDKDGCDFNAFRMMDHTFYGASSSFDVDTSRPMTVVTQFLTDDGTDQGQLVEVRQFYVQDGVVIPHAESRVPGVQGDSITDAFCSAQKTAFNDPNDFGSRGGLRAMGEALDRGMVLALSLWDDGATEMRWLDSTFPPSEVIDTPGVMRGPCDGSTSSPAFLRSHSPSASVRYSNIRYGEIGSTVSGAGARRLRQETVLV